MDGVLSALVDMGIGVGANLVGGGVLLALGGLPAGMVTMFGVGLVLAISVIRDRARSPD